MKRSIKSWRKYISSDPQGTYAELRQQLDFFRDFCTEGGQRPVPFAQERYALAKIVAQQAAREFPEAKLFYESVVHIPEDEDHVLAEENPYECFLSWEHFNHIWEIRDMPIITRLSFRETLEHVGGTTRWSQENLDKLAAMPFPQQLILWNIERTNNPRVIRTFCEYVMRKGQIVKQ